MAPRLNCLEGVGMIIRNATDLKNVLLVEDEELLRTSLENLLHASGYGVRSFSSGQAFLELLNTDDAPLKNWALVVMDVRLNGDSGLEIHKTVRDLGIQIPFIFMSAHQNAQVVNQAWRDGAHNFLFKPFTPNELLQTIEKAISVAQGRNHHDKTAVDLDIIDKFNRLTPRQKEVLKWVASGLSNTQISAQIGISTRTVKMHREAMMHRFGFTHITDLVRFHDACKSLL